MPKLVATLMARHVAMKDALEKDVRDAVGGLEVGRGQGLGNGLTQGPGRFAAWLLDLTLAKADD